ncbi:Copper-transporting P-type ATPase [Methylobrevis pamukkalensis]|uniref:P-type Zn(2+) transporter n=2 Tax=Methylobrevis pamukkalensis TaxID=1439726 RepID=A0A1E3GZG1_9HYPH|nr:Copper-transporting P-type ATPase [Methylobrevis pamukkalensis]
MRIPRTIFSLPALSAPLLVLFVAVLGLAAGVVAWLTGADHIASLAWAAGTVPVLLALAVDIVASLRRGEVGLDLVAALSMGTALAFGEPLAANVVALMYAGGEQLEHLAEGRATRDMTALLGRVARTALRIDAGGMTETPIADLVPGDRLLVRHGEVVPVDGTLGEGRALLDNSPLTGESRPVELAAGDAVASGATNLSDAFVLIATRPAAESTYAGIVRLVEQARSSKAPMARIADRYAVWFLLLTLAIAGAAWGLSGDRMRALAVLVVATPCPLILALPIAIISGMSRAAGRGVLMKQASALEAMSAVHTAILDKTGTLTEGRITIGRIDAEEGFAPDEVLRIAASLDQASTHVIAQALVAAALARGLTLSPPSDVVEVPGAGVAGHVDGRRAAIGTFAHVLGEDGLRVARAAGIIAAGSIVLEVDGRPAGVIVLTDPLRIDAADTLASLRRSGIRRLVLASGDDEDVVTVVAGGLDIDEAFAGLAPADKVRIVAEEKRRGPVMMVGDGVNDAPALALADVGVALGARGAAASSQTADVVLLVDEISRLGEAVEIARRTRRIALQSVYIGLGLSIGAMVVAAFGHLPPVAGALTQEAIDVAVILNAMRALR